MQGETPHTEAEVVRRWLLKVIDDTGLKPTPLAHAAGLAPSTLLRALDPSRPSSLERRSIRKIIEKFNCAGPQFDATSPPNLRGMAEPELAELKDDMPTFGGHVLTDNQFVRIVQTRALDLAGYLPGDLVLIDMAQPARARDAVCAQVYNLQRGSAETVLRIFEPPYLTTETADPTARAAPLLVDNERAVIMGTVIRSLRERAP